MEVRQRMELTDTNRPLGLTLGAAVAMGARFGPEVPSDNYENAARLQRTKFLCSSIQVLRPRWSGGTSWSYDHEAVFLVAMAEGSHPIPSRTRSLSLPAPMVLQGRPCGRVGRRQIYGPLGDEGAFFIGLKCGVVEAVVPCPARRTGRRAR